MKKLDRDKNKEDILTEYRIDFTISGEDDIHTRYAHANSPTVAASYIKDTQTDLNGVDVDIIQVYEWDGGDWFRVQHERDTDAL